MFRLLLAFLAVLAVSACRYDSDTDVTRGWTQYKLSGFFGEGIHYLGTDNKDELIRIAVATDGVEIRRHTGGSEAETLKLRRIVGGDAVGKRFYVGVSERSGKFSYWPFVLNDGAIYWHRPKEVVTIHTADQLISNVRAGLDAKVYRRMAPLAPADAFALDDRLRSMRERAVAKSATEKSQKSTTAAPAPAPPTGNFVAAPQAPPAAPARVNGYVIGDGIFVRGWLSDESGRIVDIDQASGKAKVLRYRDGTTAWVEGSSLISREEAAATNLARGAVAVGVMVCLFSPETCKPKSK
ncbi:MAG: hypothetical protein ACK4HF_03460 [Paracoccaceae bacterium]